jgi:DNA-binding MarR family transcriptional regulator
MLEIEKLIAQNSSWYSQYLISKCGHSLFMARRKELAPHDISPRQAAVLFFIYHLGHRATIAQIAKHAGRGMSSISIQLRRMEKDGLVKKTRETPKSAQLIFRLTVKGINSYKNCNKLTAYTDIFSVITEEERLRLISTLQQLIMSSEKYLLKDFELQS